METDLKCSLCNVNIDIEEISKGVFISGYVHPSTEETICKICSDKLRIEEQGL